MQIILFMLILHYLSSEWSKNPSDDCATTVDDSGLMTPAAWNTNKNEAVTGDLSMADCYKLSVLHILTPCFLAALVTPSKVGSSTNGRTASWSIT